MRPILLAAMMVTGLMQSVYSGHADGLGEPLYSKPLNTELENLRVGLTGILCNRPPCPWNGVLRTKTPVLPNAIIWRGDVPPPLSGEEEAVAHVRSVYREGCVMIEGQFVDGVLHVNRLLGDC